MTTTLATIKEDIAQLDELLLGQNQQYDSLQNELAELTKEIDKNQLVLIDWITQKEKIETLIEALQGNDRGHVLAALHEVFPCQSIGVESRQCGAEYLPVTDINVDARRFQFKILGSMSKNGTVGSLSGCQSWNDNLAGVLSVWRDTDDKIWVINGHNRLAKAKALGVDRLLCRFIDAKDAIEARAIGALINIGEGQGTAIDVAKFLRDTHLSADNLKAQGINLTTALARDGLALANLSPALFSKVLDSTLPVSQGVAIGKSELSHKLQDDLWVMLSNTKKRFGADTIAELTDLIKHAPTYSDSSSLLGAMGFDDSENLALTKADLQAAIKSQISKSKKLFDTVAKEINTDTLEGAGAALINTDKSEENSAKLARVLFLFDCHKNGKTELSALLDKAAIAVHEGEKKSKAVRDLEREILANPKLLEAYNPEKITAINSEDVIGSEMVPTTESTTEPTTEQAILQTLDAGPAHFDTICGACNQPPGDLLATLTMMEIDGTVTSDAGMHFRRM